MLERWARDDGVAPLPTTLFDYVEDVIGVAEVPEALAGRNALLVKRGAEALGLSGGFLRRNAPGCRGSGVCAFGCPTGAKQHAAASWLPRAEAAGARVLTGVKVRRVLIRDGRAAGVQARGLTVRAPIVVVACGALLTPGLLRRSGVRSPALGRHLTIHPASAARARFDEPIDPWDGVPQSYYVDALADEGIMLEGIAGPPDQAALATPGTGAVHRERMLAVRSTASFGVMVADSATGSVREVGGRLLVRYDLHPDDAERLRRGFALLADIWWAAGAREILVPLAGVPALRDGDSGPLERARVRPRDVKAMAFHPLGTARAGADPAARGGRPRPAGPRRRRPLRRRRQRRAVVAAGQSAGDDHGPGGASGARAGGRARRRLCQDGPRDRPLRRRRRAALASASTWSSWAAASPAPASRSTRPRAATRWRSSRRPTTPRGPRAARASSSTAACATCRTSTWASCARRCSSASSWSSSRRTSSGRCPSSCPPSTARGPTAWWAWASTSTTRWRAGAAAEGAARRSRVARATGSPSATASSAATRSSSGCPRWPAARRRRATCSTTARPTTAASCSPSWPRPSASARCAPTAWRSPTCSTTAGARAASACATRSSGERFELRADNVVNATGVWADRLRPEELHDEAEVPRIRPSRGSHITLAHETLPLAAGAIVPAGGGRAIFALPWLGSTLVGTTDNEYDDEDLDHVRPAEGDVDYLLGAVNAFFGAELGARATSRAPTPACDR